MKRIQVTFPKRWAQMGGIPKVLDQRAWTPGKAMMLAEYPSHAEMAVRSSNLADCAIYKLLSIGG